LDRGGVVWLSGSGSAMLCWLGEEENTFSVSLHERENGQPNEIELENIIIKQGYNCNFTDIMGWRWLPLATPQFRHWL
jgi:hypothetical protein